MQLTVQQMNEVFVFNDYEKQKIVSEFEYYNKRKEDSKDNDPFLE